MKNRVGLLLLAINAFASASTPHTNLPPFPIVEVADGIFVHPGQHLSLEDEHSDDSANIGFIVGTACIAVIDTGGSIRIAKQLKAAIQQASDRPICYVINTHDHFDHVLGNIIFKNSTTQFVGHKNLPDSLEYNTPFFINQYGKYLAEHASQAGIVKPKIRVENTMTIDLGGRSLLLTAYDSAHTDTDISIIDSKTNTAWLSDLLFMERIPVFDGSLKGWLAVHDVLLKKNYSLVIPGHGPVSAAWPKAIEAQQRYLNLLFDEVSSKIEAGAFMEDVINSVGNEEKKQWLLYEENHRRNVSKAFTELEW